MRRHWVGKHWVGKHWAAMLPATVAMLLALGAAPAPATGDEDAAAQQPRRAASAIPDIVSYTFVYERVSGSGDVSTADGAAVLSCIAGTCEMGLGQYSSEQIGSFPVPGSLVFSDPGDAPTCGNWLGANAIEIDLAFTESSVTGTWTDGGWTIECADGGSASMESYTNTIQSSVLVDGACHFEAGGCTAGAVVDASPTGEPAAAEAVAVAYDVTVEHRETMPDGSSELISTGDGRLELQCAAGVCAPSSGTFFPAGRSVEPFAVPGAYEHDRAEAGEPCDGEQYDRAGATSLTFSATGVTGGSQEQAAEGPCPNGGSVIVYGTDLTIVGSSLAEGECWFTAAGCATAPADAGTAVGDDGEAVPAGSVAGTGTGSADGQQSTSSRLASGDPAAPSVLSALRPPAEAGIAPQQLALAALITVILVLLMSFPTSLLNSAIDGASVRFAAWREQRGATGPPEWRGSWWWAAIGVLAAAIISAFVDPQFGANPGSLRMLVSIALGFAVDVVLGWVVLQWVMRRLAPDATRSFSFKPLTLLIVVGAVVFTRVTGFEPGIVFGLVAGLGFATTVGIAAKARTALVPLAYAFGLGIVAWLVYGAVSGSSGESLGATLLVETLSSLTVGGMVALPLALVPVKGLSGHTVWQSSRRLWAASYAIGLFAFFIVLLPMPFSWAEVGWELWAWIGVYVAYAAVAVAAWLIVKRPWRKEQDPQPPAEEPATTEPPTTKPATRPATEPAVEPAVEPAEDPAPIMAPLHEERA